MKKLFLFVLMVTCVCLFTGCKCEHEWVEANCTTPRTCTLCEETEGAPLGHTWAAATCLDPKTCKICKETQGEALGHNWKEATCTEAETCALCHVKQGEALGHDWIAATTESPKICANCHQTEGERIITDSRFTTTATKSIQGIWEGEATMTGAQLGIEGYLDEITCIGTYIFGNAGDVKFKIMPVDREPMKKAVYEYTVDLLYYQFALEGLNKAQSDAAMKQTYGMDVKEYVAASIEEIDFVEYFEDFFYEGVYYVEGNQIYEAGDWDETFEGSEFKLQGGKLIIEGSAPDGSDMEWEKIEEEEG